MYALNVHHINYTLAVTIEDILIINNYLKVLVPLTFCPMMFLLAAENKA